MASNRFGCLFCVTTWGESHGKAIGAVIDGCPAGVEISLAEIHQELALRSPGNSPFTSPRKESDQVEILSGLFEGKTTGAPICLLIANHDINSKPYEETKHLLRPGHANYTYIEKYAHYDYRGGARASARETAARVAAGAIAKKILASYGIEVVAYIKQIGKIVADPLLKEMKELKQATCASPVRCPDRAAAQKIEQLLNQVKAEGDSVGGVVEFLASNLPVGLGDPVYEKLEARLAYALMSLPATKGFEMGNGFAAAQQYGSTNNDLFILEKQKVKTKTNFAGGTLGGISNGMPLIGRTAFKPTSTIEKMQPTLSLHHEKEQLTLPAGSRHDPCVAIRAVAVVEAMVALVIVDALLMNRCAKL